MSLNLQTILTVAGIALAAVAVANRVAPLRALVNGG